jgi:hypothetical protein
MRLHPEGVVLWAGSDPETIKRNIDVLRSKGYELQVAERIAAVVAAVVVGKPKGAPDERGAGNIEARPV